ncbi:copia protein [Tanacetum coccineum]
MKVKESLNVTFDESPPPTKLSPLVDDDVGEEEDVINNTKVVNNNNEEDESMEVDEVVNNKESKNHPLDQVIGNLNQRTLRSLAQDHIKTCVMILQKMHDEFVTEYDGELNFFFGLQIKQMEDGIFFNQSKYIKEMLKKFGLEDSKPTKTPMSTEIKLTKDDESVSVDSSKYRVYADSNHTGDYVDHKTTSGIYTFMGCCLTSWFAKKQMALAISTTEAEHVSTGKACQQALWMKQALIDYDICLDNGNISLEKVSSEDNIADIFTKPLKREVFNYLRLGLGMMELIMDSDPPSS